jgi:hypothetical protein
MAYAMKPKVENELDNLIERGIISPVTYSEWATPIVPVVKGDGSVRICGDFKVTLNQAIKVDQFPIPKIEDLLANLNCGKSFTKLDLAHAYLQMEVEEQAKELLTINTQKGLFTYNRLPFGIASAPAQWQRAIEQILQGCKGTHVYFDDILVTGADDTQHLENLNAVLQRLMAHGLRVKKKKCDFMKPSLEYLGYVLDSEGIHTSESKVQAINDAPAPRDQSELRSFLGMIQYYSKFLPNLSTVLHPLNKLLGSKVQWHWSKACRAAFKKVKDLIVSAKVLTHYQPDLPLVLACDASPYGIGSVISHIMGDGDERPIAFASCTLTAAEATTRSLIKRPWALYLV